MFLQRGGGIFVLDGSNLHAPAPAGVERRRRLHHVELDRRDAGAPDANFFGRGHRKIENAAFHEGPAVVDAHQRGVSGLDIRDTRDRAERQGQAGGGHGVHVEDFAVGGMVIVVRGAVPAGHSGGCRKWNGVGRNAEVVAMDLARALAVRLAWRGGLVVSLAGGFPARRGGRFRLGGGLACRWWAGRRRRSYAHDFLAAPG